MSGRLTVGSLRGLPQPGVVLASSLARRAVVPRASTEGGATPRRCCGTGCAGCPVGERIRMLRARRSG